MNFENTSEFSDLNQWRGHWGGKGGQSATPDSENLPKIGKKSGKNKEKSGKKRGKIWKKRKVSFTLPLLTDRAGYAADLNGFSLV